MTAIDPHKPDLHASGFRAILEVATDLFGAGTVAELVQSFGVRPEDLSDPNGWFSLEFAEALINAISERSSDPAWLDRAMRLGLSPKYLGILYPLFRSFGTPAFTYKQTVSIVQRLNKTMSWRLEALAPQYALLRAWPADHAPREKTRVMCRVRQLQMAAVTTLFDLPPAVVEHPECLNRGDPACLYAVRWKEHQRPLWSLGGLAAGAAVGLGLNALAVVDFGPAAALSVGLGAGGWALGRARELRRDLKNRVDDLNESHDALERSTRANEQRYAELLDAKREVEQKVEQRTQELREATTRLSVTLREIQDIDRAKTDFFNNVSHELRSPLTLILAPLDDIVAGRTPPDKQRDAFESMHRNAARLLNLINQLLDLAKIDAGEMKIAPTLTDVPSLVLSVFKGFEAAAERKGVLFDIDVPLDMPPVVLDVGWIESALTNLVSNALRHTASGRGVRLLVEDHGGDVKIAVADDGPGIAPADQDKVFQRFAQGAGSNGIVGGTGIGLALVREAVRLHGGDVKLASELGKGSTFTLMLPRRPDAQADESSPPHPGQPAVRRPIVDDFVENPEHFERKGPEHAPLALVVEDNAELRQFMLDVLAVRYRVVSANDGPDGLAAARLLRPEVIVSDVAMPGMDGYELCRRLRLEPETHTIPLLLVTARTDVASVLQGFESGANDYVAKPFHGRELLARVDVHVRLRRMAQELALRERHAMLGVLAASVAHQVRNPLTTLVSGLPAMRARLDGHINQRTFELIDVMIDCAGRIDRLTGDLMDLSRVDREVGGEFKPSDGLRSAIRMVQARVPEAVIVEEHVESSPLISGRPGDMNHVFMNLLDNAVRAVGERGTIRIDAALEAETYTVRISDTGPGVDAEIVPRIFEPFFTTRPAGEGTGLGLAIANQVMQQCGGSIQVGRAALGGAEFIIRIPGASSQAPSSLAAANAGSSTVH